MKPIAFALLIFFLPMWSFARINPHEEMDSILKNDLFSKQIEPIQSKVFGGIVNREGDIVCIDDETRVSDPQWESFPLCGNEDLALIDTTADYFQSEGQVEVAVAPAAVGAFLAGCALTSFTSLNGSFLFGHLHGGSRLFWKDDVVSGSIFGGIFGTIVSSLASLSENKSVSMFTGGAVCGIGITAAFVLFYEDPMRRDRDIDR